MTKCKKCGGGNSVKKPQLFKNGIRHIRLECLDCGAFNGYEKQPEGARVIPLNDMLFDYQKATIKEAYTHLKENQKVLIILDTGGGKTFIFSAIAKDGQDHKRKVLILTDRLLLSSQSIKSLEYAGCEVGIVNEGEFNKPVLVSTVQTAANRKDLLKPDLVIIDEAHEGIFKKALSWWPKAKYLGFTGTPVYQSKSDPMKNYWDSAVMEITRPELIEMGRLVPINTYETVLNLGSLRKANGEYTNKSQIDVFGTESFYNAFLKELKGREPMKTVVFCPSVELTLQVSDFLNKNGFTAWYIVGSTKEAERAEILAAFKETPNSFLVNCMVATKGFDEPTAQRAVLAYATLSLAKYYQTVGRVCRQSQGKGFAEVWDYGGNKERFWDPNQKVNWLDMFYNPPKPGEGVAPVKDCPECLALIRASATKCGFCGYVFPKTEKEKAEEADLRLKEAVLKSPLYSEMSSIKSVSHIKNTFEKAYRQGGIQEAKNLMKVCADKKLFGYKRGFWIFACARGIFRGAYKEVYDENPNESNRPHLSIYAAANRISQAFGHFNPDFYKAVLTTASNNALTHDILLSNSAKYYYDEDLENAKDEREDKDNIGDVILCRACSDNIRVDEGRDDECYFCQDEECQKAEFRYHVG